MKKLLYILLFIPFCLFGQTILSIEEERPLNLIEGWNIIGFTCDEPIDVVEAFLPIVDRVIITKDNNGAVYMPEFGFNGIGFFEFGYGYQLKLTESISDFQFCPFLVPLVEGCMDETAFNYNSSANMDDGSCIPVIYGCLDSDYVEYNSSANTDTAMCFTPVVLGCTDDTACNYDSIATVEDNSSCEYAEINYDCNGNITAEIGDIMEGGYLFYLDDSGTRGLVVAMEDLTELGTEIGAGNEWGYYGYEWGCYDINVLWADGQAIGTGYQNTMDIVNQGCSTENGGITAAQAALAYEAGGFSDWFLPSTDELSEIYYSIGHGGVSGNLGGFLEGPYWSSTGSYFSSQAYVFDNEFGHPYLVIKYGTFAVRAIRSIGNWTQGCIDSLACNYSPVANMSDGSCEYSELGYDCDGNVSFQVGDETLGGFVFYVDETGQHGLVAAMEDLTEGATDPNGYGINGYEWGCYGSIVNGADGTSIGTGYQNTMDIVNQGCSTENGGITAAQAALDAEINGYSDWYLPSEDELHEMNVTIGYEGSEGNIGGFLEQWNCCGQSYFSSTEHGIGSAKSLRHQTQNFTKKFVTSNVRVIRSFGNWTQGCIDSLACNYNPEANMSDGSCEYSEPGYDCDGNISFQVGDETLGGFVFYVDETGQHGLVAAMEDLTEGAFTVYTSEDPGYEWGCYEEYVDGADGQAIGTGYQNTMDIVNQGCSTYWGGITAAQAALDAEINGYNDWYLPSKDELLEMDNTIGIGGPMGNIGGFEEDGWNYWSSSETSNSEAWFHNFCYNCGSYTNWGKATPYRVRVIRSF